ncbi:MAG: hypothetical protein HUU35_09020, partial [Armatimonadetes bacterium]|nr:hypothetical protein [Armatimonadota bacterium]
WSPGALVAVGQGPPPLLDGLGNEPAWQAAIALQGFRTVRGLAPAEGGTTARLRFDQNNLYLLFECDEPILSVAQQRTHEFRTRGEADGPLWNDDAVVVLLAPPGGPVVDLFVNGAGTMADARCSEADLWGKRDASWQSGAQAAVHRADGRWGLELAIPFAPLGGKPTAGTRWGIQLGRLAAARGESSSWSPCPLGFHDAASFGTLVFAAEVPGLELAAPAILEPGGNPLKLTVHPATGAGGLLLRTSLSGARRQALSHYVPAGATALEAVVDPSGESAPEVDYRVLDAATLQPLLQTAPAVQRVSLARAALTLTAAGPWELHVNDQLLARGEQAKEQALNLPLRRGPNRLELRSESGVPVATLALPNAAPRAVRWKLQPTAETSGSEDRWPTAPQQHSGRAVLRHTILWEKTRLWPKPDPAVYICRESNQHLTFIADGLPGRALPDYRVHLRLPAGYQVVGSTGYYGHQPQQPHFTCAAGPDGTVTIAADEPLGSGRHPIMSLFNVLVRPAADAADGELTWWCEASDGTVTEAPQTVPLRLLERVDGRQPKRLVCQMWGSFFSSMDDPAMRAAGLELMRASGVTDIVAGDALTTELAHRQGLTHTLGVKFVSWSLNLRPYLEQHPEQRLLDQQGKPQPELLCTSLLLGDSWAPVEEQLALLLAKVKPDTVDYDFEYSPLTGPHSCYCERCLTAFRTAAGLDQALALTPASIAAQHEAAWTDFMCQQVARVMARLKESVHQLAPGTRFSVYSGYQTATNPRQYGLDWRYVGALRACDRAGCGYGRPAEELTPTLDALGEIPVLYGELLNPYDTAKDEPVRPLARAHLLRRYLDSTGGLLVYDRLPMDGRCWQALADVNRLVADHEALFISGRLVALPGLSEDEGDSLTDGRTTLVCLFNPTSRTVVRKLALPAEAGAGQEYYRGHRVQAGERVEVELTPGEIAVYILRRK